MTQPAKFTVYVPVRMSEAHRDALRMLASRMGTGVTVSDANRYLIEHSPFYRDAAKTIDSR